MSSLSSEQQQQQEIEKKRARVAELDSAIGKLPTGLGVSRFQAAEAGKARVAFETERAGLLGEIETMQKSSEMKTYNVTTDRDLQLAKTLAAKGYTTSDITAAFSASKYNPNAGRKVQSRGGQDFAVQQELAQAKYRMLESSVGAEKAQNLWADYLGLQPTSIRTEKLNPQSGHVSEEYVYLDPLSPDYASKSKLVEKRLYETYMAKKPTDRPESLGYEAYEAIMGSPKGGSKGLSGVTTPEGTLLRIDNAGTVVSGRTASGRELGEAEISKERARVANVGGDLTSLTGRQQAEQMLREETKPVTDPYAGALGVVTTPEELVTSKNPALQKAAEAGKSFISTDEGVGFATVLETDITKSRRGEFLPSMKAEDLLSVENVAAGNHAAAKNVLDAMLPSGALVSRAQIGASEEAAYAAFLGTETKVKSIETGQLLARRVGAAGYQELASEQRDAVDRYAKQQDLTRYEAMGRLYSGKYGFIEKPDGTLSVTRVRKDFTDVQLAKYLQTAPQEIKTAITIYSSAHGVNKVDVTRQVATGELIPFYSERSGVLPQPFKLLTKQEVQSEQIASERQQIYAIGEMKRFGWNADDIKKYFSEQKYMVDEKLIESTPASKYVLREKSVGQQIEEGLAKPYSSFLQEPEVSIFDDVFAAAQIVYGETVGMADPSAKKVAREGYATMNKVLQYYASAPYELGAEVYSEAGFAILTGFGIGTAAKVTALKVAPKVLAALSRAPKASEAIPLFGKAESGLELAAARDVLVKQEIRSMIDVSTEFTMPQKKLLLRQLKDIEKLKAEVGQPIETGLEASHYRTLNRILKDVAKPADERAADFNRYVNELTRTGKVEPFKETGRIKDIQKKYGEVTEGRTTSLYENIFESDVAKPTFSEIAYRRLYEPAATTAKEVAEKGKQVFDDVSKWLGFGAAADTQTAVLTKQKYQSDDYGQWLGYDVKTKKPTAALNPYDKPAPSSLLIQDTMNEEIKRSVDELNSFSSIASIKLKPLEESPKDFSKVRASSSYVQNYTKEVERSIAELNKFSAVSSGIPKSKQQQPVLLWTPEEYEKQLKDLVGVSSLVYDPLTTVKEKTFNIYDYGTAPSSRKKERSVPTAIAKLQSDIEQSFKTPFDFGRIPVGKLNLNELTLYDFMRFPKQTYRTPTTRLLITDLFTPEPTLPNIPKFPRTELPPTYVPPFGIPRGFFMEDFYGSNPPSRIVSGIRKWHVRDILQGLNEIFGTGYSSRETKRSTNTRNDFVSRFYPTKKGRKLKSTKRKK